MIMEMKAGSGHEALFGVVSGIERDERCSVDFGMRRDEQGPLGGEYR